MSLLKVLVLVLLGLTQVSDSFAQGPAYDSCKIAGISTGKVPVAFLQCEPGKVTVYVSPSDVEKITGSKVNGTPGMSAFFAGKKSEDLVALIKKGTLRVFSEMDDRTEGVNFSSVINNGSPTHSDCRWGYVVNQFGLTKSFEKNAPTYFDISSDDASCQWLKRTEVRSLFPASGVCGGNVVCGPSEGYAVCEASGDGACPSAEVCYRKGVPTNQSEKVKRSKVAHHENAGSSTTAIVFQPANGKPFALCGVSYSADKKLSTGAYPSESGQCSTDPAEGFQKSNADQCLPAREGDPREQDYITAEPASGASQKTQKGQ